MMNAIINEIGNFVPNQRLKNAKIYFYGIGSVFKSFYHRCRLIGCQLDKYDEFYFVDTNPENAGGNVGCKSIITLDEIDIDNAIVFISVTYVNFISISKALIERGLIVGENVFHYLILDVFVNEQLLKPVLSLRNSQKGKSCFIVGTGPSLEVNDLKTLQEHNSITFSMNGITKLFNETEWRPNYIVVHDKVVASFFQEQYSSDITYFHKWGFNFENIPSVSNVFFFALKCVDVIYFSRIMSSNSLQFSEDIFGLQPGGTTTYSALQLANFMGFEKIFLLGVDNAWMTEFDHSHRIVKNNIVRNHFVDNYSEVANSLDDHPNISYPLNFSYECAKKYAEEHGIKIFNATRGGNLEVFDRVNFDDIFKGGFNI